MGTSADKCHRDRKRRECARVVATASQRQRPAALFSIAVETVRVGLRGKIKNKKKVCICSVSNMAKLLDSLGERLDTTHRSIVGSPMQILAGGFSHMLLPHPIVP